MTRYLAIDFGLRRVGLAVGDSTTKMAFPRITIDRKKEDLWQRLQQVIAEEGIDELVLGWPKPLDGKNPGRLTEVIPFAQELAKRTRLCVHQQDEAYSSVQALERTAHVSRSRKRDKGLVDRAAAAIFLQEFLEKRGEIEN